jgi:predicted acetyltransferase
MLPVRAGNVGSERAVERNGGRVEGQDVDQNTGEVTRYYWITLDE